MIEVPSVEATRKASTLVQVLLHIRQDIAELSIAAAMALDVAVEILKERYDG